MAFAIGVKAIMEKYPLGALEKSILSYLADSGPGNKNVICKGTGSYYKNVFYAVDRMVKKDLLQKIGNNSYSLSFEGLVKALRLGKVKPQKAYKVIERNKITLPRLDNKIPLAFSVFKPVMDAFSHEKMDKLTLAFMEKYPQDYFERFLSLSDRDSLAARINAITTNMVVEHKVQGKYDVSPIPELVKEIADPLTDALFKLFKGSEKQNE